MNKNLFKKVDFLIIGAQKSGTTAFDSYLRDHYQVCMANKKEVHFFDKEPFSKNIISYMNYNYKYFKCNNSKMIKGETTPIYLYWDSVPKRIWEYNPNIKLILILRNPIERAYSHWNMERQRGKEKLSFMDALFKEEHRAKKCLPFQDRDFSYIDRGFYTEQIRRYNKYFKTSNILIFKSEDLKNNPQEIIDISCDFLNIDKYKIQNPKTEHTRTYARKMDKKEKEYLKNIYEDEIRRLEKLLGWNCDDWLK